MRNQCIEILTYMIKLNRKKGGVANVEQFRDDILVATLKAYSPEVAPQH